MHDFHVNLTILGACKFYDNAIGTPESCYGSIEVKLAKYFVTGVIIKTHRKLQA